MMSPKERYERDPVFKSLVDLIHSYIAQDDGRTWTPTELREACMLACAQYEYLHIRPIVYDTRGNFFSPPLMRKPPEKP
jgi:hypothetical protein